MRRALIIGWLALASPGCRDSSGLEPLTVIAQAKQLTVVPGTSVHHSVTVRAASYAGVGMSIDWEVLTAARHPCLDPCAVTLQPTRSITNREGKAMTQIVLANTRRADRFYIVPRLMTIVQVTAVDTLVLNVVPPL